VKGNLKLHAKGSYTLLVDGPVVEETGPATRTVQGDLNEVIQGKHHKVVMGDEQTDYLDGELSYNYGWKNSIFLGNNFSMKVGGSESIFIGGKTSVNFSLEASYSLAAALKFNFGATFGATGAINHQKNLVKQEESALELRVKNLELAQFHLRVLTGNMEIHTG